MSPPEAPLMIAGGSNGMAWRKQAVEWYVSAQHIFFARDLIRRPFRIVDRIDDKLCGITRRDAWLN